MKTFLACLLLPLTAVTSSFNAGTAIRDITGPAAEVNLMGYANPGQVAGGIHMRLRARAFVFQERNDTTGDMGKHFAFVSADMGMASDLVTQKVVEELDTLLGEGVYTVDNLCISGTHTHSGPAGFLQYTLFQVTSLGFVNESFTAFVGGIAKAVAEAHGNLTPAKLSLREGELEGANINRSPTSYLLNPESERARYDADTDLNMVLLRLDPEDGGDPMGAVNWFAVHGTSLNNTNRLLSGDNRGYASYLLEQDYNGPTEEVWPGAGDFVAAFASSNLGDVSPNTEGAKCIDTGLPCDNYTSTCPGKFGTQRNELCIAFGPGTNGDMFESAEIIGRKQFEHAKGLMNADNGTDLSGPVDFRHLFVNMSAVDVELSDGSSAQTCRPAMGYGFAAGTTDGPGMFNFHQATLNSTPFFSFISDVLSEPSEEEVACQSPKPILLNLGGIERPYPWDAEVVPVQLLRLGSLFIAAVPSEFTTMAGRRLREAIASTLVEEGVAASTADVHVVIAGLANSYSDYVTTFEEYQAQRYEAASTIYGPQTHQAYVQLLSGLARDMARGESTPSSVAPPDLEAKQLSFLPAYTYDAVPTNASFGAVVQDVESTAYAAGDRVEVTFWGANPRANLRTEDTYLRVEREDSGIFGIKTWTTVATDSDFATRFLYKRVLEAEYHGLHYGQVTVCWDVPSDAKAGQYRIRYFGDRTIQLTKLTLPFQGVSSTFSVAA